MLKLHQFSTFGNLQSHNQEMIEEIVYEGVYEKFFNVQEDDVVVDIGANVGFFPFTLQGRGIKKIYCIEPSLAICHALDYNLQRMDFDYSLLACGVADKNGMIPTNNSESEHRVYGYGLDCIFGMTWQTILRGWQIPYINFMKIDCEGGEYDVFTDDNYEFLTKKVKYIVGEWHIHKADDPLAKWRKFHRKYLLNHPNHRVFEPMGGYANWKDVTLELLENNDSDKRYTDWYYSHDNFYPNYYVYMNNEHTFEP